MQTKVSLSSNVPGTACTETQNSCMQAAACVYTCGDSGLHIYPAVAVNSSANRFTDVQDSSQLPLLERAAPATFPEVESLTRAMGIPWRGNHADSGTNRFTASCQGTFDTIYL
eukprot:6211876-Pleurochrysis_carterae.AAC.6